MLRISHSNFAFSARQIELAGPLIPSGARKVYERASDYLAADKPFFDHRASPSHAVLPVSSLDDTDDTDGATVDDLSMSVIAL